MATSIPCPRLAGVRKLGIILKYIHRGRFCINLYNPGFRPGLQYFALTGQ